MSSYNKALIVGRLGRDPELRYTQSGTPVVTMSVATDESYTDQSGNRQERTEWHRVVVFGKQAENCSQYLAKGRQCLVEGPLQTQKWQDQQGQDRYTTQIKALRVVFLGGGGQGQGQGQQAPQGSPGPGFPSDMAGTDEVPF